MIEEKSPKVIVYGGNGFIGIHAANALITSGANVVCLSRTGHKPLHLKEESWGKDVRWCKGDASKPNVELLKTADVMVCLVGSPPLPTFSSKAYDKQFFSNGTACVNAIEGASQAGVKKVILLGAKIPSVMQSKSFAYFAGKQSALRSAKEFASQSESHSSIVIQPGMVTGRRVLDNGKAIRLDWMTSMISPLLPSQFTSVERVAQRIAHAATNIQPYEGHCTVIVGRDI